MTIQRNEEGRAEFEFWAHINKLQTTGEDGARLILDIPTTQIPIIQPLLLAAQKVNFRIKMTEHAAPSSSLFGDDSYLSSGAILEGMKEELDGTEFDGVQVEVDIND